MLPIRSGTVVVGNESRMRLDAYYRRYCEGENNKLYGLSHIVYACHASFPMLLSPEMANLIWLNFRLYPVGDQYAAIDRVVVSDFLLSPLVRQVAAEQYEVIPEIRNYLLHLLQDGQWFDLFLIGPFGNKRMSDLASFLEQYLKQKKDNDDEVTTFRQVNEWAAKAYLNPDELALEMANAMKETFDVNTKQRRDEYRQLYINTLANRFRQQFDVGIVAETVTNNAAFLNFQLYSNANNALLFGKQEVADSLMMQLHNTFITQGTTAGTAVELPMAKEIGERLERKKSNVQKVKSLLVAKDETLNSAEEARTPTSTVRQMLMNLNGSGKYDSNYIVGLVPGSGVEKSIIPGMGAFLKELKPEEIGLVYCSGNTGLINENGQSLFITKRKGEYPGAVSKNHLTALLENVADNKNKIVVFLDIDAEPGDRWKMGDFITFHTVRPEFEEQSESEKRYHSALSTVLADAIHLTRGRITYRQLHQLINFYIRYLRQLPDYRVVLQGDLSLLDNYFLSHEKAETDNRYMIIFNYQRESWQVLEEDFTLTPMSLGTGAYDFTNGAEMKEVIGEFFVREDKVLFNGQVTTLDTEKIYKAEPRRPVLAYEMILADPADNDKGAILHALGEIRFDKFSKWSQLEERGSWTDMAKFSANRKQYSSSEEVLLVEVIDKNKLRNYRIKLLTGDGHSIMPLLFVEERSVDRLPGTIKKLLRHHYLVLLERPTSAIHQEEKFKVNLDYRWDYPQSTGQPLTYLERFEIPENAIRFSDGELTLYPLVISLVNQEEDPVYFSLYILFPDLSIYKAKSYSEQSTRGDRSRVTIDDPGILKKMTNYVDGIQLKVLVSRDPIKLDFSQNGITE